MGQQQNSMILRKQPFEWPVTGVKRKFKSDSFQAWMGRTNEDKQVAVARTLCFPPCSIILPREEF